MTRDEARMLRKAVPKETRSAWSRDIAQYVLAWEAYQHAETVMAYMSIGSEVETAGLLQAVLADGKRLALPRCEGSGIMHAKEVQGLDGLQRGTLGIFEPPRDAPTVHRADMDIVLVPGLLFDRQGNRMGQGAGYYDRFLSGFQGTTCGLAFSVQVVDNLSPKPHDIPICALVTECGFVLR